MIALAVTRAPIENLPASLGPPRRVRLGGWWLTAAVDGPTAAMVDRGRDLVVQEQVPSPAGPRAVLFEAAVAIDSGEIRVTRLGLGGRAFLHARTADGGFAGSTHVWSLRALGVPIAEDPDALPEYYAYGHVTPPASLFLGVSDVPIGATLTVRAGDSSLALQQTLGCDWLAGAADRGRAADAGEVVESVIAHLSSTVGRLAADGGRVVSLLSGGLDSSVLTRVAASHDSGRRSLSCGFPFEDPSDNGEREYALTAASAMSTEHRYFEPTLPEFLDGILTATIAFEQPVYVMQSVLLSLLFARERPAAPGDPVLCGEGADGIFGGPTHTAMFAGRGRDPLSRLVVRSPRLDALLAAVGRRWTPAKRLYEQLEPVRDRRRAWTDLWHPVWEHARNGEIPWVLRHFGVPDGAVIRSGWPAIQPFLDRDPEDLVTVRSFQGQQPVIESVWSKLAEAAGWTMVYPYTDDAMVRTVMQLPWDEKLREPKYLLRLVARRLGVPEFVITRPKLSFSVDTRRWSVPGGPLEPLVPLAARAVPIEIIRDVQRPGYLYAHLFWRALVLGLWRRLVIQEEPIDRLRAELAEAARSPGRRT